jgi:type II secretory ATPase GspE/PulE/Tfp pilus assembly ATPase PilB-like protein
MNMWLKPYILASALDTIIAQRLVRRICNNCKVEKQKTKQEKAIIETMMKEIWMHNIPIKNMKLYKWKGCEKCNNSWFKWRIWLYEIINLNDNIREIIRWWWSVADILEEAKNWWLITMKEDGILKAIKWHTTIEEILRVI